MLTKQFVYVVVKSISGAFGTHIMGIFENEEAAMAYAEEQRLNEMLLPVEGTDTVWSYGEDYIEVLRRPLRTV